MIQAVIYSYILFLTFVGGMYVVFICATSLAFMEMYLLSMKRMTLSMSYFFIPIMIMYFLF